MYEYSIGCSVRVCSDKTPDVAGGRAHLEGVGMKRMLGRVYFAAESLYDNRRREKWVVT